MTENPTTPIFRMARAVQQIASPYSLSNQTILAAAVPVVLSNLVLDFGREKGTFGNWLLIALLGYLSVAAVLLLARNLLSGMTPPAIVYLLVFLLAGFVRGVVIFQVGTEFGVIPPDEWQYRLLGSPLFILVSLSLVTVLVSNSQRATKELANLETSRLVLEKRLSSMRAEISRMNSEVAGNVSGLISPVIQELMVKIKGSKELAREIQELRTTVDEVVRPLSIAIAEKTDEMSSPQVTAAKVSIRENFRLDSKLQVANQIVPFWSSALITLISTPAAVVFYGQDAALALALLAVATVATLELAYFIFRRVQLRSIAALLLQVAIFATAGGAAILALSLANLSAGLYPAARIITLAVIIGLAMFIGQIRQTQRYASQQKAREVNEQLELLNSQARRELWLNRRRIATVLHGPVQAALYASAMRLAQSSRPSKKLIQSVNQDLADALEVLKFDSLEETDLRDVIGQITEVWSGTCEIYSNISKAVYQVTKKNPLVGEAVTEVLREAVSNAIKHGSATEIEIDAKVTAKLVVISIVNNGKSPVNSRGNGFGSKLYSELTHTWQLERTPDSRTKFSATVFVA
jgi:signal transduction histidine kinase